MSGVRVRGMLRRTQIVGSGAVLCGLLALSGCGNFFSCEGKADCGTGSSSSGSNTGDYVYTTNASTSLTAIAGYSISSTGTLTALSGSPFTVSTQPTSLAVNPANTFLYAASANSSYPGIYVYSLASSGVPSNANSGTPVNDGNPVYSMVVSPDGGWLYTIELSGVGYVIGQYQLVSGIPQAPTTIAMQSGATCVALTATCSITVSPNENFIIAVAGNTGAILYPYSSSSGVTSAANPGSIASASGNGDFSVVVDTSNYAYISKTTSIESYLINASTSSIGISSSSLTSTNFTSGETPHSILTSNGYVFTANPGNSTISSFTATAGVLGTGAEVRGPTTVYSIGVDNSGKFVIAAGKDPSIGLQAFSIGTGGALSNLNQNFKTNTGSSFPIAIALTH